MKIELGDLFIIETQTSRCFLQYCYFSQACGYLMRVFVLPKQSVNVNLEILQESHEDFSVFFFLKQGLKDKSVNRIGKGKIPISYKIPEYMRDHAIFESTQFKWRIVPLDATKKQFQVEYLSDEQAKLSPYQIWYSKGLIEKVDSGFCLNSWR